MIPITLFSQYTPANVFDLRCEYEVPRFLDLDQLDNLEDPDDEYLIMGAFADQLPR